MALTPPPPVKESKFRPPLLVRRVQLVRVDYDPPEEREIRIESTRITQQVTRTKVVREQWVREVNRHYDVHGNLFSEDEFEVLEDSEEEEEESEPEFLHQEDDEDYKWEPLPPDELPGEMLTAEVVGTYVDNGWEYVLLRRPAEGSLEDLR